MKKRELRHEVKIVIASKCVLLLTNLLDGASHVLYRL